MDMKIVFPGGKRVDALFDDFTVKTDQSAAHGGDASAPEPFTMFLVSIGTCAGIYVLSFCQHRDLSTKGISLTMSSEVDPETKMTGTVKITINVPDEFPQKYHKALIRSAEQCAVKKHVAAALPEFKVDVITESEIQ